MMDSLLAKFSSSGKVPLEVVDDPIQDPLAAARGDSLLLLP